MDEKTIPDVSLFCNVALTAIQNLNNNKAWAEHPEAATLAPSELRSSVRFRIPCPGFLAFHRFGITGV
jgi:hypothetical protein